MCHDAVNVLAVLQTVFAHEQLLDRAIGVGVGRVVRAVQFESADLHQVDVAHLGGSAALIVGTSIDVRQARRGGATRHHTHTHTPNTDELQPRRSNEQRARGQRNIE